MKTKILKSHTIIPSELYVYREADRILSEIIENMGRPGYILVARQMGKTNLLLNTKRVLQDADNIYVYIDLSTINGTVRDYFQNIIDTAIDTHKDLFSDVKIKIDKDRQERSIPEQKEHDLELRQLLKIVNKRMVIILDEIDALTRTPFSDTIFAQIRSIYFQRDNYNEFYKLTYILSGVIEPSEIIKDKRISPFNIGQKIYLSDFNYNEFEIFIKKTGIDISRETKDRIFYWTNGNPRMTWDVCSDLEDKILLGIELNPSEVDLTVKKIYLLEYDHAPIDHIRELVESDKAIKDAITVIKYKKGDQLSDDIKRKLYLAGIINSNYNIGAVSIKNRIIEESLSDDWLLSIDKKKKGLLKIADDFYGDNNFVEADKLYREYIGNGEIDEKSIKGIYYKLGVCNYKIFKYKKAIEYFEQGLFDKEGYANIYYDTIFLIGLCHLYEKNYESSIEKFREIVESKKYDDYYYRSLLNLSGIYQAIDVNKYENEIRRNNNEIIENIDRCKDITAENGRMIKSFAYYNIGKFYEKIENKEKAKEYYSLCADHCNLNEQPTTLMSLYEMEEDLEKKRAIILKIKDIIINNNIKINQFNFENLLGLTDEVFWIIINELYDIGDNNEFMDLTKYAIANYFLQCNNDHQLFLIIAKVFVNDKKTEKAKKLFASILSEKFKYDDTPIIYYETAKYLLFLEDIRNPNMEQVQIYLEYFSVPNKPAQIDLIDFNILVNIIHFCLTEGNKFEYAREILNILKSYRKSISIDYLVNYYLVDYYDLIICNHFKDSNVIEIAHRMYDFSTQFNLDSERYNIFTKDDFGKISEFITSIIKQSIELKFRNYSRNQKFKVKYKDGKIIERKFKYIEDDLKKNNCEIIE